MKRNERILIKSGRYRGKEGYYLNECVEPALEGRHYVRVFPKNTMIALLRQQFEIITKENT